MQVGHEAPTFLNVIQDLDGGRRRGGFLVKRESVDHSSSPFVAEKTYLARSGSRLLIATAVAVAGADCMTANIMTANMKYE